MVNSFKTLGELKRQIIEEFTHRGFENVLRDEVKNKTMKLEY